MNRAQKTQLAGAAVALAVLASGFGFVRYYNAKADAEEQAALAESKNDGASSCRECEDKSCGKLRAACQSYECKAAYRCIAENACGDPIQEDFSRCYCGATNKTECFVGGGAPQGPCKDVMEKAAKSQAALEVGQRFYDMSFALGQAVQFANCRMSFCKQCR